VKSKFEFIILASSLLVILIVGLFLSSQSIQKSVSNYFIPNIKYNNLNIKIPKYWILDSIKEKNKDIKYFGFLELPSIFLYLNIPFRKNTSFNSVAEEIKSIELSKVDKSIDNSCYYTFYDKNENEYMILFRNDNKIKKEFKKNYNLIKLNKYKQLVSKKGFMRMFNNFPKKAIMMVFPKSQSQQYDNFVYQIDMDEYILTISLNIYLSDYDMEYYLAEVLKDITKI